VGIVSYKPDRRLSPEGFKVQSSMQKPLPTPDKKDVKAAGWWLWLANLQTKGPKS
jgi:hypothetical protein